MVARRALIAEAVVSSVVLSLVAQAVNVLLFVQLDGRTEVPLIWTWPSLLLVVLPTALVLSVGISVASSLVLELTTRRSRTISALWLAAASATIAGLVLVFPRLVGGQIVEAWTTTAICLLFGCGQFAYYSNRLARAVQGEGN